MKSIKQAWSLIRHGRPNASCPTGSSMDDTKSDIDPNWLSWKVTREEEVDVSQYCADRPYLEFEVPAGVKRVHRVVFTTVSHDQGRVAPVAARLSSRSRRIFGYWWRCERNVPGLLLLVRRRRDHPLGP